MRDSSYNALISVAIFVVAFFVDLFYLSALWHNAFIVGRIFPATFGIIRWYELVGWVYEAILGLILGVVLASLIRGSTPTRWIIGFGICFGLVQYLVAGHSFTSNASIVDRIWILPGYLVPVLTMVAGAKLVIRSKVNIATTQKLVRNGLHGRQILVCLSVFLAAAATNEFLRGAWTDLFGYSFKVYLGFFSGMSAVQYLFDFLLFVPAGIVIGLLLRGREADVWAIGVGLVFGLCRFLNVTHNFSTFARWHDYAAIYGQYLAPALGAYLGIVVLRLVRKPPTHASGTA